MFLKITVFIKFRNINRTNSVLESLFKKVADKRDRNFNKNRLQHWCFSVNIAKFLRKAFFCRTPPVAASAHNTGECFCIRSE